MHGRREGKGLVGKNGGVEDERDARESAFGEPQWPILSVVLVGGGCVRDSQRSD